MTKKNPAASEKQIVVRFDERLVERIERHVERLAAAAPGIPVTRAAAIRSLVISGLDAAETKNSLSKS